MQVLGKIIPEVMLGLADVLEATSGTLDAVGEVRAGARKPLSLLG